LPEPLACLLSPGPVEAPAAVAALGARALLDLAPLGPEERSPWPTWLAPHQVPAAERLRALLGRWGGAPLADAPGPGKAHLARARWSRSSRPRRSTIASATCATCYGCSCATTR